MKFHLDGSKNACEARGIYEYDHSYFVWSGNFNDSSGLEPGLLKLDFDFNLLWSKLYKINPDTKAWFKQSNHSEFRIKSDTIIFWGNYLYSSNSFVSEHKLLKIKLNGEFAGITTIQQDKQTEYKGLNEVINSNGELVILCIESDFSGQNGIGVIRIDADLNFIDHQTLYFLEDWRITKSPEIHLVNDTAYVIVFVGNKKASPITSKDSLWTNVVVYDSKFNYIKGFQYLSREYWSTTDFNQGLNIRPGGYYLIGEPYDKFGAWPNYDAEPSVIMGLDSAFHVVWSDTLWFEIGIYVSHRKSFTCKNGDLVGIYSYRKSGDIYHYNMILRIDKQGNILWKRIVREGYEGFFDFKQYLHNGIEDSEGNLVFAGFINTFEPIDRYDGWVLKLDADGCFSSGCNSEEVIIDQVTSVLNVWEESKAPLVFPNPIRDQGRIELPNMLNGQWELRIYDSSSRLIQSSNGIADGNSNDIPIDCSDIPNGVYFGQVKSDNQFIQSFKVVVIH